MLVFPQTEELKSLAIPHPASDAVLNSPKRTSRSSETKRILKERAKKNDLVMLGGTVPSRSADLLVPNIEEE